MNTNLVSLVNQFLTPDMIGRIASVLGLDRNIAQTAIGALVPSLLAGFSGLAAQPGGAQKLVDAATQQSGALEGFARMLGSGNQSSFIDSGSRMLSSLLGSQDQNALAGAIGKFAGLGQGTTGSLLGMLAPVVLGTMAQQQGTTGLNPRRIADLLAGQKDNIAAALPPRLGNLLAGTGLLDSLGTAASTAASTATAAGSEAARAAASAARAASDTTRRAAGANWLYWLIPIAAVAALFLYLAIPTEQVTQLSGTSGQGMKVSALDINKQATDSIASLRTALGGITDAASAQAALPKLKDAAAQIDKVSNLTGQLSVEQRGALASLVKPLMPTLNQLFDQVLAVPGVSDELKPTIDALKTKLATLAA